MRERLWLVGEVIYRHYAPLELGRVKAVMHRVDFRAGDPYNYLSTVFQVLIVSGKHAGEVQDWGGNEVAGSLADLIADHQKKLAGHNKRLLAALAYPGK